MAGVPPFGTYAPSPLQAMLIALCGNPVLRRGFFRRIVGKLVAMARPGPIDVERGGARYRLNVVDNAAETGILLDPRYQEASLSFLRSHLKSGGQFVDCGANVGQYALAGAVIVGPSGKVVAVEPTANPLERLRANIALSGFENFVSVAPVAAGESDGELRFEVNARDTALSKASTTGSVVLPMKSLLTIVREASLTRIDLLKIDVEGMEDRILAAFLKVAPQELWPKAIIMEDELSAEWQSDARALLERGGYRAQGRSKGNVFLVRSG